MWERAIPPIALQAQADGPAQKDGTPPVAPGPTVSNYPLVFVLPLCLWLVC